LLHALQYCGHFIPFWILPAAFAAFHSAPHFLRRARAAFWAAVSGFLDFGVVAGALAFAVCAAAFDAVNGTGAAIKRAASAAASIILIMTVTPLLIEGLFWPGGLPYFGGKLIAHRLKPSSLGGGVGCGFPRGRLLLARSDALGER